MRVELGKLRHLWNNYNEYFLECIYVQDQIVGGKKFRAGEIMRAVDLSFFERNSLHSIDLLYTEKIYSLLSGEFPADFRRPYGHLAFLNMDRQLEALSTISNLSRRRRFLHVVGDIYGSDPVNGKRIILSTHNDELDYKRWNEMKRFINKDEKISYRSSENGIILLVNMKPDADSTYLERFKKNADLVTAIVTRKKDSKVEIAPDFIPTEDAHSVNDPDQLLEEYKRTGARLIIIGENITDAYKRALLEVKQYDRFVRMMVVPFINPQEIEHFLMQVKLVYNSDRW
jgi:hypothetical protein